MKPHEISAIRHKRITLRLFCISGQICFWFRGHFAVAVTPRSCTNRLGDELRVTLLAPGWRFHSIQNIKFQSPLLPDNRVTRSRLTGRKNARF